jgi:multiple antibiotic resistance protein
VSSVVNFTLLSQVFITLFVIMDPPGAIPMFLSLTRHLPTKLRQRAATQASLVALGVIVTFALFGRQILAYLNISLAALQCAGGLLLLLVSLELLTGRGDSSETNEDVNVALVPLGTPLLAGPGAIVATMVFSGRVDAVPDVVAVALGVVLVHLALWVTLRFSTSILRLIRESGITLVTRIAGLLLAAIAVQLVADAVRAFVTGAG